VAEVDGEDAGFGEPVFFDMEDEDSVVGFVKDADFVPGGAVVFEKEHDWASFWLCFLKENEIAALKNARNDNAEDLIIGISSRGRICGRCVRRC